MLRFLKGQSSSIRHRIGLGYGIAIGVGFLGFMTGLVIADYYQGQGIEQLADAQIQAHLLMKLKDTILQLRIDNLELTYKTIQDPSQLHTTQATLLQHLKKAELIRAELARFVESHPSWLAVDHSKFQTFLQVTQSRLDAYDQLVSRNLQNLTAIQPELSPSPSSRLQASLKTIEASPETAELDQLLRDLSSIVDTANQQEFQAGEVMEAAQGLEKLILVVSALLSLAIAGVMTFRVTRQITEPIIAISQVAEQAADDSNFMVKVAVDNTDELGQLANALNRLIQRVAERTRELQETADLAHAQAAHLQRSLTELRVTQTQLIQTEKMSSLGRLVGGIAHEINNPTTFIQGNLIYAQEYAEDLLKLVELCQAELSAMSPELQAHLEKTDLTFVKTDLPRIFTSMQRGTDRIRDIVRSLQNFSRLDESGIKAIDLHESLDSTLMLLKRRLRATADRQPIRVIKDYGNLPLVECYAGELNQVLMHILTNALDAIDESVTAETSQDYLDDFIHNNPEELGEIRICTEKIAANQVRIQIANNGPSIPPDVQAHLFEPFYTTKPMGRGTGNGLFTSYQIIVEQHGGKLWCVSHPPRGAEFFIELPIQQRGQKATIPPEAKPENVTTQAVAKT